MDDPFPADAEDTRTAIMRATYDALCEHGYADLTIQRIGEAFPKSKSLLYHHYDGKDALLLEFLALLLDRFEERELPDELAADPEARLRRFVERIVPADADGRDPSFARALVELRAQAAHDDDYRAHFTRTRERVRDRLAEIIEDGVEDGVFRDDVDPDAAASFLATVASGAMFDAATTDAADLDAVRDELERYVDARIVRD